MSSKRDVSPDGTAQCLVTPLGNAELTEREKNDGFGRFGLMLK